MPQVPQYQRQVAAQLTPTPYRNDHVNGDMFGANVAQAQGNVGKALGDAADTVTDIMFRLKDHYDQTKKYEFVNAMNEYEQNEIRSKENGYLYKTGKDAMGKSQEVMKGYDDYAQELFEKYKFTPRHKREVEYWLSHRRMSVTGYVEKHDFDETNKWNDSVFDDGYKNIWSDAVFYRNDANALKIQKANLYSLLEQDLRYQKADDEHKVIMKHSLEAAFHGSVLNGLIADGSLKASEYFKENEQFFTAEQKTQYLSKIHAEEINYKARTTAEGLLALPLEQQYSFLNSMENIDERNATERELNRLKHQQETLTAKSNNETVERIAGGIEEALKDYSKFADIQKEIYNSDLPFDIKKKLINHVQDVITLGQEAHLWNDKAALDDMMMTDNEKFKQEDLSKYVLTKAERDYYKKQQDEIVEYSAKEDLMSMAKKFSEAWQPSINWVDRGELRSETMDLLARVERLQGKAFDLKNIDEGSLRAFRDAWDYKDPTQANSNIDETKELFARSLEGAKKTYEPEKTKAFITSDIARQYVAFKKENKREPEPAEMYEMVKKTYNGVGRMVEAEKKRINDKINYEQQIYKDIAKTSAGRTGYTPVLAYFENNVISQMEKETGVKMKVNSTYRSPEKNKSVGGASNSGHLKGMALDIFPANPTKENIEKAAEWFLSHPVVDGVMCNNPNVKRYIGNKKLKYNEAVAYEKKTGVTHTDHFHISLTSKYGGTNQIIPAQISAAPPKR